MTASRFNAWAVHLRGAEKEWAANLPGHFKDVNKVGGGRPLPKHDQLGTL